MPSVGLTVITIFLVALLFTHFSIVIILKSPLLKFFIDKPGARHVHQRITPRVGGLAILVSFVLLLCSWRFLLPFLPQLPSNLFSALIFICASIFLIGLADDLVSFEISNKAKFIGEIIIAVEIVVLLGIHLDYIHLLGFDISIGWLGIPISIFWLVGVANAVNIIDGLDGLAGSVLMGAFGTISLLAFLDHNYPIVVLAVILGGLLAGFLLNNISPARVFLGDTGSLLIGMICAVLSISLVSIEDHKIPVLLIPLIVGYPIIDLSAAMIRRFIKTFLNSRSIPSALKAMTVADSEHIHHRLMYRGLSHTETVVILFLFQGAICMCAVVGYLEGRYVGIFSIAILLMLTYWLLHKLDFFERVSNILLRDKTEPPGNRDVIGVLAAGKVLPFALNAYEQDIYLFEPVAEKEIIAASVNFSVVIIEKKPEATIESTVKLASVIFNNSGCPAVVIVDSGCRIPEHIANQSSETSFLLFRDPIYVPVLLLELKRLIKKRSSRQTERIMNETRSFYRLVASDEKI
jgi:UDP-GlcNAc:undecaprenyl-phosphate/decaprenyl-phosphate GlcNAc-1-phosphate transferase